MESIWKMCYTSELLKAKTKYDYLVIQRKHVQSKLLKELDIPFIHKVKGRKAFLEWKLSVIDCEIMTELKELQHENFHI